MEELLTVALRVAEFDYHDEEDQYSFLASFAHQVPLQGNKWIVWRSSNFFEWKCVDCYLIGRNEASSFGW